jgi:uncharacterized protein YjiS (DUF1127 family)
MFSFVKQLALREFAEWRRRAMIEALAKLSDPQLDDVGLRRDQLYMLEMPKNEPVRERPVPAPVFRPRFEPCG